MDFLLECGISEEALRKIRLNNSEDMLIAAEWNIDKVVSSINYFKELGIKVIDKLLINRFDIFLRGRENLEKSFDYLEVGPYVQMVNKDIKYIYYLDRYLEVNTSFYIVNF